MPLSKHLAICITSSQMLNDMRYTGTCWVQKESIALTGLNDL